MSLNQPASKEELADFCLRQLGEPVIQVNVDSEQVNDAIEMAYEYWTEFHFDGTERTYLKHQITADDKANGYIQLSDAVIGAVRIFPISGNWQAMNMFDMRYQLRLNDMWDLSSTSYVNYSLTMQHLRTLDLIFSGEVPVRFNKVNNKLYIDQSWASDIEVGEYIIVECMVVINPEVYTKAYNNRMFKRLATAYIKRQWGNNMKKFGHLQLPGGVVMNGQTIYEEAVQEIKEIEASIRSEFEAPPQMLIG